MNYEVIVTCAITGAGDTVGRHPAIPVTPQQIADSAIEAAKAGASIVHCHVRDPKTGKGTRDVKLYREVVERIRGSGVDVVLNLTCGMGGDVTVDDADPMRPGPGTDLVDAMTRIEHVVELRPEICTLDCGTMNFAEADYVMTNTPGMLRTMAAEVQRLGVRPELEVFDTGHLVFVKEMIRDGLLDDPVMIQLCMGIPYGAPDDPLTTMAMVHQLPAGAVFSGFSISRNQLPFVAMAALAGGNCRVGLEDNLYIAKGQFASNGALVERAAQVLTGMGARLLGPAEVRAKLKLTKR